MQLLIAGDLAPTQSNISLFNKGDVKSLLGDELLSLWSSADLRIINLETPLTDKPNPILKCGPNLFAPTSVIKGIKALQPTLLTLANNHILDQGEEGLKSTQDVLKRNNIPHVGVGNNIEESSKPYIIEKDGVKIGVYACAEHEFSIAGENTPGANPFDPLESLDHICYLKAQCDYVIVLYLGGKEHYRYPSPSLQKICRKIAQKGADLIVCQHSHCIGTIEKYYNSTIVYGQGNFIFDYSENEYWKTSILISVILSEDYKIEFIPICKNGNSVVLANEADKEKILNELKERSTRVYDQKYIEEQYKTFAMKNRDYYLRQIAGLPKILRGIDKVICRGKLVNTLFSKKRIMCIRNIIECEAHRELFLNSISNE